MNIGDQITLITFNGTSEPELGCPGGENYHILIGKNGSIVQSTEFKSKYAPFSEEPRLLIQFEANLNQLGLINHNDIPNSLWILESDLKLLPPSSERNF